MKTNLLLAFLALITAGESVGLAAGFGKLLKNTTETKTSDDAKKAAMPPYKGVKYAIGVSAFENEANYHAWSTLGNNLRFMLESALAETGRFVMVERIDLGAIVAEQDLQSSGRAATATSVAETGKLRSAKYVATGAVTELSDSTSGDVGGIGFHGIRIGGSSSKSAIVIVVKLVDTTTGEVVATKRVRGEAGKTGLSLGLTRGVFSGDIGSFAKTPLGEAVQDCMNAAVAFIVESMQKTPIEGSVVAVTSSDIVIGMGENYGVTAGQQFIIRKEGELLKDPETGAILDRMEGETTGLIEITRVREKTSYCKLLNGAMPIRGDRVVVKTNTLAVAE